MYPGNLSFLSARVRDAAAVWPDKRIKVLGVCLSLPSTPFFFFFTAYGLAPSHRGRLCDTKRHQTRQCTQTETDVRGDVLLFLHSTGCLGSAASLASQSCVLSAALRLSEMCKHDRATSGASS